MFSWLGQVLMGATGNQSLELPSGELYIIDPLKSKNSRALTFREAKLTLGPGSQQFEHQLVVSQVLDEDDEEPEEDEQAEIATFVTETMEFTREKTPEGHSFKFKSADGKVLEFVADKSTNSVTLEMFEQRIYECIYEAAMQKPSQSASESELDEFIKKIKAKQFTSKEKAPVKTEKISVVDAPPQAPSLAVQVPEGNAVVSVPADLYLYDVATDEFNLVKENVRASLLQSSKFEFSLLITEGEPFLCQPVETRMMPVFNEQFSSFLWVWFDETTGNPLYSWSIRFASREDFSEFRRVFGKALYEISNHEAFEKIKSDDQDFLLDALMEDVEMEDVEADQMEQDAEEEEKEPERTIKSTVAREEDPFSREASKNSQLAVGMTTDRSFVVRGNKIGVFKYTDDDDLSHVTTINNVGTPAGNIFSPHKVMLHERDRSMLLMKPDDKHNIFKMDLEYGKVIEEWKVDDVMTVDEIVPDSKYAQMTGQQTLVGINKNALFRIDPRLNGNKRVDSESKQYVTKNKFSCAATTGKGELAVASEKGEIRLYNKLNMRAKTHLPGLGDPIIGIDTTESGRWVIATCKTYLLLIDTQLNDGSKQLGFQKSMGTEKPAPKRLQLRPEHVAALGMPVSFTPAKFNTGQGEEKSIVTSTGPFVITWNFRRVKQGKLSDYQIKQYGDTVVADNFKFGQDRNIIVTLPENVEMASKSQLSTPVKLLKSRSAIVNSPY